MHIVESAKMPHSVSPPPGVAEHDDLPDASAHPPSRDEAAGEEDAMDESRETDRPAKKNVEVKIDEFFPDDEEDDEFTTSAPPSSDIPIKMESSPPLEPLYVCF